MNSIASHQNNVNMTLWSPLKGISEGLLYPDYSNPEAPEGSLGSITKSCNPDAEEKQSRNEKRFKKQEIAMNLIGGRLNVCGRVPVPIIRDGEKIHIPDELQNVPILQRGESFSFAGMMHCGSVWNCPVCASIITEMRRQELQKAHDNALAKGLHVSMLTLTVPHYKNDRLKNVLDGITDALRKTKNRKAFKKIAAEIGLTGNVRTLEVTYGENGWHPHFHILLFTTKNIDAEIKEIENELLLQWQAACVSSGLPCPNEHGLTLVDGTWAARYCSKWGIEEEMTKGHLKNGKKDGHVSPFGLLDLYEAGDLEAGRRFQEYAEAFKGKRQLVWSKGLREMLDVEPEKSDAELIEETEEKSEVFMTISYVEYKKILLHEKRAEFLFMCSLGKDAVKAWLKKLDDLDVSFPFSRPAS